MLSLELAVFFYIKELRTCCASILENLFMMLGHHKSGIRAQVVHLFNHEYANEFRLKRPNKNNMQLTLSCRPGYKLINIFHAN